MLRAKLVTYFCPLVAWLPAASCAMSASSRYFAVKPSLHRKAERPQACVREQTKKPVALMHKERLHYFGTIEFFGRRRAYILAFIVEAVYLWSQLCLEVSQQGNGIFLRSHDRGAGHHDP